MIRWAVFVSGQGTNLQNVLDLEKSELKSQKVVAVVSDRSCPGIERARAAQKETLVLSPKASDWNFRVLDFLKMQSVDSIFLLGYMRILPSVFLRAWKGRLVNLHPSLLPKYPGLDAVKRAFEAGDHVLGATLHEVVEAVDAGRILRQIQFSRNPNASFEETVSAVHAHEHRLVREYLVELEQFEDSHRRG
jgi:phosphoribosylglycinamide formyltransferase-1